MTKLLRPLLASSFLTRPVKASLFFRVKIAATALSPYCQTRQFFLPARGPVTLSGWNGEVPATMEELVTLPGVGRKTANVILGNAFDIPGITVDTHFGRLVRRWRWTAEEDPVKVEQAVGELIERKEWTVLSHRVIFHGRRVCHARKPACGVCVLAKDCPSFGTGPTEKLIAAALVQGPETEHLLAMAGL